MVCQRVRLTPLVNLGQLSFVLSHGTLGKGEGRHVFADLGRLRYVAC